MARVLLCDDGDYDAQTGTCADPYYGESPSSFPTLSVADAQQIGLQIAVLWAVAFGLRWARRALMQ